MNSVKHSEIVNNSALFSFLPFLLIVNVYNGLLFARSGVGYAWSWLEEQNIEINRDAPGAQSGLVINYIDSAGVIYASGVCKLYSTSA